MNRLFTYNSVTFAFIYSFITLILYHKPLFLFALSDTDIYSFSGMMIFIEIIIAQLLSIFLLILLLSFIPFIVKPLCILFLITNSIAYYFVTKYNVILDKTMMGNVFNTDVGEVSGLYSSQILLYVLALGIFPSLLIAKIKITSVSKLKRIGVMGATLAFVLVVAFLNSKTWLWFDKNSKRLGGMSMPLSYTINSIRHATDQPVFDREEHQIPDAHFINDHKTLVVLIIGESARASNFSLYGYGRNTNPYLTKDDVVALPHSKACTTYTTESIKCILSHLGSNTPSRKLYELLPAYLQRHHINVLWRSNNWGEPPMKLKKFEKAADIGAACQKDCDKLHYDEVLLYKLEDSLKNHLHENNFIVLHSSGSHGPSYYTKYPAQFEHFKPTCETVDLQKCTHDELVNAYDNTIVYTDYFVHQVITLLKSLDKTSSVMIYLSDHGESLGEYNIYLHGTPYSIAPDVQKQIPFIVWMSDMFKERHKLTNQDLAKDSPHSQDNIFSSVMGAFGMRSEFYNKKLDIFHKE
jgi:lipid A ethanolaminephosphotransferase